MTDHDAYLLLRRYRTPRLYVGDRAFCLYRDADVVITSWTDARIPWPRCRAVDTLRGGSGLLVDEELARAVRCESSLAIQFWWGVSQGAVWKWKKALGVGQWEPEGSRRLHQAASETGADRVRGQKLPREDVERRRQKAWELGLQPPGALDPSLNPNGSQLWTETELALLGDLPDEKLAKYLDRSTEAVRVMRTRLGIPTALDHRRRENRK